MRRLNEYDSRITSKDIHLLDRILITSNDLKDTGYKKGRFSDDDKEDYFPILVELIYNAAEVLAHLYCDYDGNYGFDEYFAIRNGKSSLKEVIKNLEEVINS